MKVAWQVFKKSWGDFAFWQKTGWVVFFPLLFGLLLLVVYVADNIEKRLGGE